MKTAPHSNGKDGGVPLYCTQCAYTTTRRDLLTRHAKTHEAAAQQCDQCSFASSRLDVLTKHRKTAHEGLRQANTLTISLKNTYQQCFGSGFGSRIQEGNKMTNKSRKN